MVARSNKRKREMDPVAEMDAASLVSIRKSDVPVYLKQGEFFQSLHTDVQDNKEDDEVIFVPKNTLKADLTIENCANLDHLLSSLRYWGVDRMIPEIVDFVVRIGATADVKYTLKRFKIDFNYASALYFAMEKSKPGFFYSAANHGDVELLRYLRGQLTLSEDLYQQLMYAAALEGHIDCVKYLETIGGKCDITTVNAACKSGNVECLKYAYEKFAIENRVHRLPMVEPPNDRNIDCYIYAYHNCRLLIAFSVDCLACMMLYNGIESIQYGIKQGIQLYSEFYNWVLPGNLDVMQHLHSLQCPLPVNACTYFATEGNLEYLKFAHENGCAFNALSTAYTAIRRKDFDLLQYALDHGCPFSSKLLVVAVMNYARPSINHLLQRNCPIDVTVANSAASSGQLNVLKNLRRRGCPWDASTCAAAVSSDRLRELTYLHEHGCPWDAEAYRVALLYNRKACLKYLRKHGFPIE